MKSVVITKVGGPEVLQVQEKPDPTAKTDNVRIRVKAAGINFADILARKGMYQDAPKLPCTVGYEVCGVIDQIGEDVPKEWLGEEVIALSRFNGHTDTSVVPIVQVFKKPKSLSFAEGAALPVTYLTAYQLLVVMGNLQATDSVLIHNVGGGVGLAQLDIANHIGATSYGTASSRKHEFLKERGLNHAIDYNTQDWGEILDQLTDSKGVELITDPIGGGHIRKSSKHLRSTGRVGMFGISTVAEKSVAGRLNLIKMAIQTPIFHPFSLMMNNRGAFGVNMGNLWHEPEKVGLWMEAILAGYEAGWVKPYVDKVFKFDQAADAHQYIEDRKNIGKVILEP